MKILLLTLMTVTSLSAQFVSPYEDGLNIAFGLDVRNATIGGTVNPPALNYTFEIYERIAFAEIGMRVEKFNYLNYTSTGFFINHVEDLGIRNKWELVFGVELGKIYKKKTFYDTKAGTFSVRYRVGRFKIAGETEYRYRYDLNRGVLSNRVKLIYQITRE